MTTREDTFTGEYRYSIDSKGRINIPAKFRQSLSPDSEETFVVTKGLDPCVWIYPLKEWERIEDNLRALSFLTTKERRFIRQITRWATPSKYDKQGRVMIPAPLIEITGLEDQATIVGVLNKIEVWHPETLNSHEADALDLSDDFVKALAQQIKL